MLIDKEISGLKSYCDDKNYNWVSKKLELQKALNNYEDICQRSEIIKFIERSFKFKKDLNILDYGCGSGTLVIILLLMGYKNVVGVDIVKKFDYRVVEKLKFSKKTFSLINGKLPYPDKTFDFINSSQVLEHVNDLENYYKEAARVLKDDGLCYFSFPHRKQLYDTHTKTYIIHWFPKILRKLLYDLFARQSGKYINDYLFLKTISHHKKIASKYFSSFTNITGDRIANFNKSNYKGNLILRTLAHKLMNKKFVGKFYIYIFSFLSSVDIVLKK